jgi:hypothetical protein
MMEAIGAAMLANALPKIRENPADAARGAVPFVLDFLRNAGLTQIDVQSLSVFCRTMADALDEQTPIRGKPDLRVI